MDMSYPWFLFFFFCATEPIYGLRHATETAGRLLLFLFVQLLFPY